MRDHSSIVRDVGAQTLGQRLRDRGFVLSASAPQRWADRNSIPGEYWQAIADEEIATLGELAAAAAARRSTPDTAEAA